MTTGTVDVQFRLNGKSYEGKVSPRTLLVDVLRDECGTTSVHIGCDEGICGACTVLLDGEVVKSCMVLAIQVGGKAVGTLEGEGSAKDLDVVQQAFGEEFGLQCGFCTPGMIISARALLKHNPSPTDDEIRSAMVGNLCRCTGYQNIVKAVKKSSERLQNG